jgi:hypothetical protein
MTKGGKAMSMSTRHNDTAVISEGDWEEAWRKLGLAVRNEMSDNVGKWANITISHEGTVCDTMFCMANKKD